VEGLNRDKVPGLLAKIRLTEWNRQLVEVCYKQFADDTIELVQPGVLWMPAGRMLL